MTPDIFMQFLLGILIGSGIWWLLKRLVSMGFYAYKTRQKVPNLTHDEIKSEKKRLNKLLKTDHDAAIVELAKPQYDPVLQILAKSHKRDEQLVALSKMPKRERTDRGNIQDSLDFFDIAKDDEKTARYITRTTNSPASEFYAHYVPITRNGRDIDIIEKMKRRPKRPPPPGRPKKGMTKAEKSLEARVNEIRGVKSFSDLTTENLREVMLRKRVSSDGLKIYTYDVRGLTVDVFTLTTPWDELTATYHATYGLDDMEDQYSLAKYKSSTKYHEEQDSIIERKRKNTQKLFAERKKRYGSSAREELSKAQALSEIVKEIKNDLRRTEPIGPPSRTIR